MPSPSSTPAEPGRRRDQNSSRSAVSATGSRSQLINAAAATQGEAASIMASHGRSVDGAHLGPDRDQEQSAEQHGVDVDEDQRRTSDLLDLGEVGALRTRRAAR